MPGSRSACLADAAARGCLWCVLALFASAHAESPTVERVATIAQLFDADEARDLARTLPADQAVKFRVRLPAKESGPAGVMVFVKPVPSGEMPAAWIESFDRRRLGWISADDFGNDRPTAQRVLVAMMAVRLASEAATLDPHRIFIAGMSGGGRVASEIMTRFPRRFAGALYIVGANDHMPGEPLLSLMKKRRFVFITGSRDFNRHEMRQVSTRYQRAGVTQVLLMDLPDYGHQYPDAGQVDQALDYLLAPVVP